jgi:hypothetical protein
MSDHPVVLGERDDRGAGDLEADRASEPAVLTHDPWTLGCWLMLALNVMVWSAILGYLWYLIET